MATKVFHSSSGSQSSSKGRRSERRGRRERCRTQVYEGHYQVEPRIPLDEPASSDQSQRFFKRRHKSCDSKVDLKSKHRSLPSGTEEPQGSESDSPEENLRKWARRPRRSRGDPAARHSGSGNSSANQQHRSSYGSSQKHLNVPSASLSNQPSSDSAIYMRQKDATNSSNGSKSKFQKLEERRRQRLDMAVTSDEEAWYDSGTPPPQRQLAAPRNKMQNPLTNGNTEHSKSQSHHPHVAYASSFNPAGFSHDVGLPAKTDPIVVNRKPGSQIVVDSAEELAVKRPVSVLKAQFEKQAQTQPSAPVVSKTTAITNVTSSGPSWRVNQAHPETRRFSADSAIVTASQSVTEATWQTTKQFQPPSVSIKPVRPVSSSVQSGSAGASKKTTLSALQIRPPKDHNFNDADSLDELLESNKDYLLSPNPEQKTAAVSNIKHTIKTLQQSAKPSSELHFSNLSSNGRTSDPKVQKISLIETVQSNQSGPKEPQIQSPTKPIWPSNILNSLSPKVQSQSVVNGASFTYGSVTTFQPNVAQASKTPLSPGSDTLEDLWIPRRSEPKNNVQDTQGGKHTVKITAPKKPERTFIHKAPIMVVTEAQPTPKIQNAMIIEPQKSNQLQHPSIADGLTVPPGGDGMFSDVDYNIEVSERVKKWEFLLHEKNIPARNKEKPDMVSLVDGEEESSGNVLSPRSRLFPGARLSVIDEKSEAKNMFGYPSPPVSAGGSGIFTNSGGDLMLSHNQMRTYPGSSPQGSPPKGRIGPRSSVRHERQETLFGDEAKEDWVSDWYFKGSAPKVDVEDRSSKVRQSSASPTRTAPPSKRWNTGSYGSSPTMTRKIVYEPLKPGGTELRLNPFYGPSSDSEVTNPLYIPLTKGVDAVISPKKTASLKTSQSSRSSSNTSHRRQDSDDQIWKEIERMTTYARAIATAATSASQSRSDSHQQSQIQKSPTRRSAYEPLTSQKSTCDPFVPLSVDVTSAHKKVHMRYSTPYDNVPMLASAKVFQPQVSSKSVPTKSIQYQHIPVTDKYQRPEALDEVLEEITTSMEKKPFSPKTKSPGMSSSSQWSTGSPDKPPLSPDIISMSNSQHMYNSHDPTAGRPTSMAFPSNQGQFSQQKDRRATERKLNFINLAHGKEYHLDHNLLKQKLLRTGLVDPLRDEEQHTDTGSSKTLDSDSGSQQSFSHVNNAIRELRQLATDVEGKIDMIKTRLVTTKEEDLDTVLMTLRRCSSNLASAKSGYVGSSVSAKSRKTKLNDALSELERIYQSLDLNENLLDSSARRDYSTSHGQGSQWSITSMTDVSSLGSYPQSGSEFYTDTNLSDYNIKWQKPAFVGRGKKEAFYSTDGLERLTQALESSGVAADSSCDSWSGDHRGNEGDDTPRAAYSYHANRDDMAQRRFQSQSYKSTTVDMHTPTESLSALSSEESGRKARSRKKDFDLTEEGSYRKIRTKSATRMDADSPNISPSPAPTDYLAQRARSEVRSRMRIRPEKDPDVMHDDMAYRNLRKDVIIEHPKPPPRSSSLHRAGKKSDEGSDSDGKQLCHAETQTCHHDDRESSGEDSDWRRKNDKGRSRDKARKYSRQEQKRRRSLGRGVAKMVERFSSSEDERQQKRPLEHSRSAPDLTEKTLYSDAYNAKGDIISTETDTNKEDEATEKSSRNKKTTTENGVATNGKTVSTKSQTPRTVKQRNEAKSRVRTTQHSKSDIKNGKQSTLVNGKVNAQNRSVLKAKTADKISSSDQTPLGSSCEGSPASARLLIHRRTKKVPLATISTTSTSGEESASGSRTSLNQTMALPQGGVIKRQIPSNLPKGTGAVKMRNKDSNVRKEEREERSKSVPELCARFETDPSRLKAILGSLRKSVSTGVVPTQESYKKTFRSEPNLRDKRVTEKVISKGKRWR